MPDSASGVSMTRLSPKSFCSPSVTRNTPPSLPTSSPMTRTLGSVSRARRSDSLIALARAMFLNVTVSAMSLPPVRVGERRLVGGELGPLLVDEGVSVRVCVLEDGEVVRILHGTDRFAHSFAQRLALDLQFRKKSLVRVVGGLQVAAKAQDRVLGLPGGPLVVVAVAGRVVGGGVGAHAVGERLDQRRPLTGAGPLQGPPGHGEVRQHVVAVHPQAREAE